MPGQEQSDLYDAIPYRHTHRNAYHLETLPPDFVEKIRDLPGGEADVKVFMFTAVEDRNRIVETISRANEIVYADPQVDRGSNGWVRTEWSDVQKFRDGLIWDESGECG